jgi:hypothetical protein
MKVCSAPQDPLSSSPTTQSILIRDCKLTISVLNRLIVPETRGQGSWKHASAPEEDRKVKILGHASLLHFRLKG